MGLPNWGTGELDEAVASGEPVLVDLRADWCPQCGPQEAVLERILPGFEGVRFGSVDIGEHEGVADRFGVRTLPSLLLFNRGEHVETVVGFKRGPAVREALTRLLDNDGR